MHGIQFSVHMSLTLHWPCQYFQASAIPNNTTLDPASHIHMHFESPDIERDQGEAAATEALSSKP